jgi:PAS domain S-box-containing protein
MKMKNEPQEEKQSLIGLLDASVDGMFAFDRESRYTVWNRAMERITGFDRGDVLGRCAFDIFPHLKQTGDDRFFFEALAGRSAVAEDQPYSVPEARHHGFLEAHYSPLYGNEGEVVGGIAVLSDISHHKRAQAEASAAHRMLNFHIENSPLAVIEWDSDFRVSRWSGSAEKLFGWTAEEVLQKHISDWAFVFPADVGVVAEVTAKQRQGIERQGLSLNRNYTKSGEVLHCEWYNSVLCDESGNLVSVLSHVLDVTARERAVREIEFQARLLNAVEQAVIATDSNGTTVYWNRFAEGLYGWRAAEAIGRNICEFIPINEAQAGEILAGLETGNTWSGEFLVRRRDETTFIAEGTCSSIYDGEGVLIGYIGLSADITTRKRAEEALRESEDRYRDLVDNSHELICTHDLEGRILSVNPWAARVLRVKPSSLIGMNIRDGLVPEHRDEFDEYILRIKRDGFAKGLMQVKTANGRRAFWEYHNTLRTEGVDTPIVRGMAHDVTERRQALAREKEARKEAEEANRLKDEFLSTLSHELRTPLTSIIGWAKLLRTGELDETRRAQALETIGRNARSQAQLIDDLLDVSRIITGKLRIDMRPVEPASVVEAAVDSIRPAAAAKGIALELQLDRRWGLVSGDPNRLQQVIWNLLSNAVKFTRGGGHVGVRLVGSDSDVEISVTDTGYGISPDFLTHVFDRFRQADGSTTRTHGGLGLGLAIVRHIVEMHGGTVSAESDGEGHGATFRVKLPLYVEVQRAMSPRRESEPATEATGRESAIVESQGPMSALQGLRVLLVEDDGDNLELLAMLLSRNGAKITAVSSAAEALIALEEVRPDVLVSDIGMPEEDGYSLISKVRLLPPERGGNTPAAALTAYARTEDRVRVLAAGYQLHLAKPVEPAELVAVVASLAGRTTQAIR